MAWIQMRDFWTFRPTEVQENKRHLFECRDSKSDTGHSLLVHVAASHSGIVNGNRRFYRPDKMQESVHTWLPQKASDGTVLRTARPVLISHDEKGDVLGRVLEAKYIDESWKYATEFPVVKDFLFYQRDGRKRHDLYRSVDWIVDNLVDLDEYTGLGYTDLGIRITNPEAIRKVLADEYLTVSIGFKTDAAVCSLCHTDWAKDGKCGHKLGEIEDGRHMFLIAGAMVNEELSFINFAADPFATTLSKKVLTDSLEKAFFLGLPINEQNTFAANGLQLTDGLIFEADLQAAEEPMFDLQAAEESIDVDTAITQLDLSAVTAELKSKDLTRSRAYTLKDSLAAWTPESDEDKSKKRSLVSTVNVKIRVNKWDKVEDAQAASESAVAEELNTLMEDAKKSVEPGPSGQSKGVSKKSAEKAKEFQQKEIASKPEHKEDDDECECAECEADRAKSLKKKDSVEEGTTCDLEGGCDWTDWVAADQAEADYFADADGLYAEMELEMDGAVKDGLLPQDLITDAKLSSEKRNKLSKGSFCGPNRSFPVPDCAHVTAARRLIGRAKISDGTKSKILACVDGKSKTLKCEVPAKKATDGAATIAATDSAAREVRAAKFVDSVKLKDAAEKKEVPPEQRSRLVDIIKELDKSYDALPKDAPYSYDVRWILRSAVRAVLTDWDADDEVTWALQRLAGNKDHVVLTRAEVDEKDETINGLMSEKDALSAEVTALKDSRNLMLASTKKSLAQQIVMSNVLKGQDGYKDLSQEQISEKIDTLSKRHITSLRDSVSDILSGLKWTDSQTAAPKPAEATGAVDDKTQISETAPVGERLTDAAQAEADEAHERFLTKLRFMTPLEQLRLLGQIKFDSAQTK